MHFILEFVNILKNSRSHLVCSKWQSCINKMNRTNKQRVSVITNANRTLLLNVYLAVKVTEIVCFSSFSSSQFLRVKRFANSILHHNKLKMHYISVGLIAINRNDGYSLADSFPWQLVYTDLDSVEYMRYRTHTWVASICHVSGVYLAYTAC